MKHHKVDISGKLATVKDSKTDVSSVSPSSESIVIACLAELDGGCRVAQRGQLAS